MQVDNKIQCALCGQSYHFISPTHLRKKHDLSTAEYKKLYPGAPLSSPKHKATLLRGNKSEARKKEKETKQIECEWCENVLTVETKSTRRFCSLKCSYSSRKGIGLSNTTRKKIGEKTQARMDKEKHPWERIEINHEDVPEWLVCIFEKLSETHNVKMLYKLPNGYAVDIAFPDKKIGVSFSNGWKSYPSVNPIDAENIGWNCCDVFSTDPKLAIGILNKNLKKVGRCPSIKTPYFRYVSQFYDTYKDSLGSATILF